MKELVDQIKARLGEHRVDVPEEEIATRLKKLIVDFRKSYKLCSAYWGKIGRVREKNNPLAFKLG